jgi:hypothetical protein
MLEIIIMGTKTLSAQSSSYEAKAAAAFRDTRGSGRGWSGLGVVAGWFEGSVSEKPTRRPIITIKQVMISTSAVVIKNSS